MPLRQRQKVQALLHLTEPAPRRVQYRFFAVDNVTMMPTTLTGFLQALGVVARFFDCGRRLSDLSGRDLAQFESGASAYPSPYLQHAWLSLLFWEPHNPHQPLLWFVKLPLDEQGKLVPAARDRFLQQLLSTVGTNLQALQNGEQLRGVLEGNPCIFIPTPERQACMHARARQVLQQPPSPHYQPTLEYLAGSLQHWQNLSMQGIADVAMHWEAQQSVLLRSIPRLPPAVLISLCHCLENAPICTTLTQALVQRLEREREMPAPDDALLAALVRSLSASTATELRQRSLLGLLYQAPKLETLVSIATRCPQDLLEQPLCLAFLEALAQFSLCQTTDSSIDAAAHLPGTGDRHPLFERVLADVLFLPALRPRILACLRHPDSSPALRQVSAGLRTLQRPH